MLGQEEEVIQAGVVSDARTLKQAKYERPESDGAEHTLTCIKTLAISLLHRL